MLDIIELLPDSVANQIAAGEVVQRPASVVKELLENSIDAGSTNIQVIIRDGGKGLIQVVDNGVGMSETDARMCFERHATSKIKEANDLFAIRTMGFRGEALASIAAVAEVELQSRTEDAQVGTEIKILGTKVVSQKPISTPVGTAITVKNLFFNIPARRKFLKSTSVELKHIINEFQRVALANPNVSLSLAHNGADIYKVPQGNTKQRIVHLMGKNLGNRLIDLNTQTSVIGVSGFLGTPESAKKSPGEQFFFVNNRYFRSPYLHRAVTKAYEKLLPPETIPPYFIFFEADPATIDVNIHPTKTDIKFEDERAVWQILNAAIRETLGKFAVVPSIDFESDEPTDIPFFPKSAPVSPPEIEINPLFNPFHYDEKPSPYQKPTVPKTNIPKDWQDLYEHVRGEGFESFSHGSPQEETVQTEHELAQQGIEQRFFQLKNRYILTSVKSGLMVIDQRRAHERILYEKYLNTLTTGPGISQQELFPQIIELSSADFALLSQQMDGLNALGVSISFLGQNSIAINALPAGVKTTDPEKLLQDFLHLIHEGAEDPTRDAHERLAISLAKASAIPHNKALDLIEVQELVDKLFACKSPNISPDGKSVVSIMTMEELEKRLK